MSLASLREKFKKISQPAFDLSAVRQHVKGNRPEEWLEYIQGVADTATFPGEFAKHESISKLYDEAIKSINAEEHKYNEAYAQLFVNFGRMKSEYMPDDAAMIFNQARSISRRFAIVHIASAQFEVDQDNISKAIKQLNKALLIEAKPREDVETALKKLKSGDHLIYTTPTTRRRFLSGSRKCSSGSETSEELHTASPSTEGLSTNISSEISFSIPGRVQAPARPLEPMSEMKSTSSSSLLSQHHQSTASSRLSLDGGGLDSLRTFRSASLLNSDKKKLVGLPGRIKRINLPFEVMNEEDDGQHNSTMDSFKPLDVTRLDDDNMDSSPDPVKPCLDSSSSHASSRTDGIVTTTYSERDNKTKASSRNDSINTPANDIALLDGVKTLSHNGQDGVRTHGSAGSNGHHILDSGFRHGHGKNGDTVDGHGGTGHGELNNRVLDRLKLRGSAYHPATSTPDSGLPSQRKGSAERKGEPVFKIPHESNTGTLQTLHESHEPPRHGLRSFCSTPLLNSEKKRAGSFSVTQPTRVKKPALPFDSMQEDKEDGDTLTNTMDSFKPLETKSTRGFTNHAHTSGYLSMVSEGTIPMDTKPTDKQKMSPVEEKRSVEGPPAAPVKDSLPVPVIHPPATDGRQVPSTPNNSGPFIPSTPMTNMKTMAVNDQQYAVLSVLGKGGSSKVYQVFDVQKKIKAIKEVNLDNANDKIVEGYMNEIKLLQRLQYCDKVIKMYDCEYKEDENKLYVVMEAGSEDLATFFRSQTRNGTPLSDHIIWFYWNRMLLAVQALHKEGIIHSDLKPANFLLVGGNLKLIDFGISKAIQQDKTSVILETQIGTLNYMSPEAIMVNSADPSGKKQFKIGVKSDVWSLGCILYNMVYGRTPFQRLNDFFKINAITNPDHPIEFPDITNKHLMDVLKKCLIRDPKQRPSIDELLDHPYLKGVPKSEMEEEPVPVDSPEDVLKVAMMEALVSKLSDKCACSPGTLRNIIHSTMEQDKGSGESLASSLESQLLGKTTSSNRGERKPLAAIQKPPQQPGYRPDPGVPANKQEAQIKHLRKPLTSLNLKDIKSGGQSVASGPS